MTELLIRPIAAMVLALFAPALPPGFAAGPGAPMVGAAVGAATFGVLARGRPARVARRPTGTGRIVRAAWLTGVAAWEEVLFRGLLLGGLAVTTGAAAALGASTAAFALAHVRQGKRALEHLVTGAAFGGVYVATGSLVAAVVTHAVYNLFVDASVLARPGRSDCLIGTVVARCARGYARVAVAEPAVTETGPSALSEPSAPAAALRGVRRAFGEITALDGISVEVHPGEVVALLGPNGAGKSTAIAILLGLRRADDGSAELLGGSPRRKAQRRHVGVVLQESAFPTTLRVVEVLDLVRAHHDAPADTDELVERFGLAAFRRRQVGGISGGERRRLALACALAGRPRLLVLDEPTVGLDVEARRALWAEIRAFAAAGGAVLLTTHQLDEADALATRLALIARGRIVAEGTPESIRSGVGMTRIRFEAAGPLPGLDDLAAVQRNGDRSTLTTAAPRDVLERLVAAGVPLQGLEVAPVTLEEAFVELTRPDS